MTESTADNTRRTSEEILRDGLGYTSPNVLAVLMKDAQKIADRKGWTLERNDFNLSANTYIEPPAPEKPQFNPWEVEQAARRNACKKLRHELQFSQQIAGFEGWPLQPFLTDLHAVIKEFEDAA